MRRNWHFLAKWQFLISCHRASEHDRDRLTEKLRGQIFGSWLLPRRSKLISISPCLINRRRRQVDSTSVNFFEALSPPIARQPLAIERSDYLSSA
jgi:hypothetical protein